MRVALYARRSKPPKGWKATAPGEQAPGSTDAQMAKLRAWAGANGHEVVLAEADTATGKNPNRPGWQRVMAAVRGGHVQGVAITRTSRSMRNTRHFLEVIEEMERRSCCLEVLEQPAASFRGKTDPMGRAFLTISGAINQLEIELHDEQSNEVMEVREDGRTYGPRSELPAGRPSEYGIGHKLRVRDGRRIHDKPKCRACRGGETGGVVASGLAASEIVGVANPGGLATPAAAEMAAVVAGVQRKEPMEPVGNDQVAAGGKA